MASATAVYDSEIDRILGPVVQARTYRNLLYLAISYPFGIVYFVLMTAGIALGTGLMVIGIGLLILAATLLLARAFALLERRMTQSMLGATLRPWPAAERGLRAMLLDRRSWTSVLYLILRLPIGVLGLVCSLAAIAAVVAMAAPALYPVLPYVIDGERITRSEPATLISLAGCVLFFFVVHAANGLAALSRRMAEALL